MTQAYSRQCALALALGFTATLGMAQPGAAQEVKPGLDVQVLAITPEGTGDVLGTLTLWDTPQGLSIEPDLSNLPPGPHGFHLHENPSCDHGMKDGQMAAGIGAGGHFDPDKTGAHMGPNGHGHKGDMPVLNVDSAGRANTPVIVPRLTLADVQHHSFIIHKGGDNYEDTPEPLGGGGARIACAVIP